MSESLAGRAVVLKSRPLSFRESAGLADRPLPWERGQVRVPPLFPPERLWPSLIEVKLTATPRPALAQSIERFRRDFPELVGPGYVIHTGELSLPLAPGVTALPICFL